MKLCKVSTGAAEMLLIMFISYISLQPCCLSPGTLFLSTQQGRRGRVNPFLSSLRQTQRASFLDSRALLTTITKPVITVCVRLCLITLMSLCCNLPAVQISSVCTVRRRYLWTLPNEAEIWHWFPKCVGVTTSSEVTWKWHQRVQRLVQWLVLISAA